MTRTSLLHLVLAAGAVSCSQRPAAAPPSPPPSDVVATVNGKPITETELKLRLRGDGHGAALTDSPETRQAVLDALIAQELFAQKAAEVGLDGDPQYRQEVQRLEAQLRDVRRRELSKAYLTKEVWGKAEVTDADAKKYFDENAAHIRTELRVLQILKKGRAAMEPVLQALAAGKPFEEVAAAQFPALPDGQKPWETPPLAWQQVPAAWWAEIDKLQPGQVSGPIAGPADRVWVLKLLARTEKPDVTFDSVKEALKAYLRSATLDGARERALQQLRAAASIKTFALPPPATE